MQKSRAASGPKTITKFLHQLLELLADSEKTGLRWNFDGTCIEVLDPKAFAQNVLPTVFKHSNYASFLRQLNLYGFKKVPSHGHAYEHELFIRDKPELLPRLCKARKTASQTPSRSLQKRAQKLSQDLHWTIQKLQQEGLDIDYDWDKYELTGKSAPAHLKTLPYDADMPDVGDDACVDDDTNESLDHRGSAGYMSPNAGSAIGAAAVSQERADTVSQSLPHNGARMTGLAGHRDACSHQHEGSQQQHQQHQSPHEHMALEPPRKVARPSNAGMPSSRLFDGPPQADAQGLQLLLTALQGSSMQGISSLPPSASHMCMQPQQHLLGPPFPKLSDINISNVGMSAAPAAEHETGGALTPAHRATGDTSTRFSGSYTQDQMSQSLQSAADAQGQPSASSLPPAGMRDTPPPGYGMRPMASSAPAGQASGAANNLYAKADLWRQMSSSQAPFLLNSSAPLSLSGNISADAQCGAQTWPDGSALSNSERTKRFNSAGSLPSMAHGGPGVKSEVPGGDAQNRDLMSSLQQMLLQQQKPGGANALDAFRLASMAQGSEALRLGGEAMAGNSVSARHGDGQQSPPEAMRATPSSQR